MTHTQTNTCSRCGKIEHWEVLQSIPVHDWGHWCFDCLRETGGYTTEPPDANGFVFLSAGSVNNKDFV